MKIPIEDKAGTKIGKWTILGCLGTINGLRYYYCRCACGKKKTVYWGNLQQGVSLGCGCDKKFRLKYTTEQKKLIPIYKTMIARCYNKKSLSYKNYGARGISVCEEWRVDRFSFLDWLINNNYSAGFALDRINNDGNYSPDNCRVTTRSINNRNKRNVNLTFEIAQKIREKFRAGDCSIVDLSKEFKINRHTVSKIINNKQWL